MFRTLLYCTTGYVRFSLTLIVWYGKFIKVIMLYRTRKHEESPRLKKMKRELAEAHSRLLMLEAKVTDAENDAEVKAEEVCIKY